MIVAGQKKKIGVVAVTNEIHFLQERRDIVKTVHTSAVENVVVSFRHSRRAVRKKTVRIFIYMDVFQTIQKSELIVRENIGSPVDDIPHRIVVVVDVGLSNYSGIMVAEHPEINIFFKNIDGFTRPRAIADSVTGKENEIRFDVLFNFFHNRFQSGKI